MLLSLLTLSSCKKKYDEDEVISAAKTLLKEAEFLNFIYYGSGIKYYDSETDLGYYRKADYDHLAELGFSTIDELKVLTEKTYSEDYANLLYSTMLSSLKDEMTIVSPARYYQSYNEETGAPEHIMVYSRFEPMFKDTVVYDYDSMRVDGSKKEKVYVKVDATVTNAEGRSQTTTVTITLVEEDDGWQIDNPTYVNYNDMKNQYDDLKGNSIK